MKNFHGLIIYRIYDNGNLLNGIYTNTAKEVNTPPYAIDCEIARKIPSKENKSGIEGTYEAKYMETKPDPNVVTHCTLVITKVREVYEFEWLDKGKPFFKGFGIKVNDDHIAVSYSN